MEIKKISFGKTVCISIARKIPRSRTEKRRKKKEERRQMGR